MILGGSGTINTSSSLAVAVAGVEDIRVDANGNVGIGTSSPGFRLDVNSGSSAFPVRIQSTTTNALLILADSGTTGLGPYIGTSGNNLIFGRAGIAEYVRVDNLGRVTTSNQPFSAYYSADATNRTTTGFNVRFLTKRTSRGTDGYNSSTGAYTAPVSGVYGFTWAYLYQNTETATRVDDGYTINGTAFYGGNRYTGSGYYGDGYIGVKGAVNVYLNQNDTFAVYSMVTNDASYNLYQNDFWGYYTAALIG
jgi:hypothetical protein